MNCSVKFFSVMLYAGLVTGLFFSVSLRAEPQPQPRPVAAIEADLKATRDKLAEAIPYPKILGESKWRDENAAVVPPLLNKMAELLDEAARTQNVSAANRSQMQCLSMSAVFGDKGASKILGDLAASNNLDAKAWLSLSRWVGASGDAKAQEVVLDEVVGLAKDIVKANAAQENVADVLMMMSQLGSANDAMSKKALAVVKEHLTSESAKQAVAKMEAEAAQRAFIGRPIRISGRTHTGANFSIRSWRGKVILVDFWATWCGPCRESRPELKKLYETYNSKGLEIVGVSNDSSDSRVAAFIKEQSIPWTQLRESTQNDDDNEHPFSKQYGVEAIPTVFLIDAKGNLRYVDGHEDLENKVKKLLAEIPPPPGLAPAK